MFGFTHLLARSPLLHLPLAALLVLVSLQAAADPAQFRSLAHEYYQWRDAAYPVATSGAGDHRLDTRLTDYKMSEVLLRRQHVSDLLKQLTPSTRTAGTRTTASISSCFGRNLPAWISSPAGPRKLRSGQLYVNECTNSIFSLLQKEYAPHRSAVPRQQHGSRRCPLCCAPAV